MTSLRRGSDDRGTVLISALLVMIVLVGLVSVYSTRTLYESKLADVRGDSIEALYLAYGHMARAEAVIFAAEYDGSTGENLAIQAALATEDRQIEDTGVIVEPVEGAASNTYYELVAEAQVGDVRRQVRALLRSRQSFADYNYFVNSHPLGIAANPSPRGSIHTNDRLFVYFEDGTFIEPVSAVNGFEYVAGATEENTTYSGPANPAADPITDLLTVDVPSLVDDADWSMTTPENYLKVELRGDEALVATYGPRGWQETPNARLSGTSPVYREETRTRRTPIYEDVERTRTVRTPVWEDEVQTRIRRTPIYDDVVETRYRRERVWVEDEQGTVGGGVDLAGLGNPGHWEYTDIPYEVTVRRIVDYLEEEYQVTVPVIVRYDEREETYTARQIAGWDEEEYVEQVFDHYEGNILSVSGTNWVYRSEGTLLSTETLPAEGVLYSDGDILALEGSLNGRMTIASSGDVFVTGSLVYEDELGHPAYLHGGNPAQNYMPNPAYRGQSVLGLIAENDILYSSRVPHRFEVNASMLAKTGRVGVTGLTLDDEGNASLAPGFNVNSTRPAARSFAGLTPEETYTELLKIGINWLLDRGYETAEAEAIVDATVDYWATNDGVVVDPLPITRTELRFSPLGDNPEAYERFTKESIRRLGGVISDKRPVSAYIGDDGDLDAGFRTGKSIYDTRLLSRPPTAFPDRARPRKISVVTTEAIY